MTGYNPGPSQPPVARICQNCEWFVRADFDISVVPDRRELGRCHISPPALTPTPNHVYYWPIVPALSFCSYFRRRETNGPKHPNSVDETETEV